MLNISNYSISKDVKSKNYSTLNSVESKYSSKVLRRIIYVSLLISLIILFLPWTQNIRSRGMVTTLKPGQKPQSINSVIAGKIDHWYVQEGDFVFKGDTILKITEIKDKYLDENLLDRTSNQLDFKKRSVESYGNKINTLESQIGILQNQRELKLSQMRVKRAQSVLYVQNDSLNYLSKVTNLDAAQKQYSRMDSLYEKGLKSLTDLELKRNSLQKSQAEELEAKNKWYNSQTELVSIDLEIANVKMKYQEELNKTRSSIFSTESDKMEGETNVSKLENEFSNYSNRNKLYHIVAPQDGYITKTISSGIGEIIKEGQNILTLMPEDYDLAVELYIDPIDLPLVQIGRGVRIQFDGWPAIVFSGWPNSSHGTYGGKVYAIDQFLGTNGKYRILVAPDPDDYEWPDALRFGSGTKTIMLLDDVSIWYELWRKINGFPPNFYNQNTEENAKK